MTEVGDTVPGTSALQRWPPSGLLEFALAQDLILERIPTLPAGVGARVLRQRADWILVVENSHVLPPEVLNDIRVRVAPVVVLVAPFALPDRASGDLPHNVPAHCAICGDAGDEAAVGYEGTVSDPADVLCLGYPAWSPSPGIFLLCGVCDALVAAGDRTSAIERAELRFEAGGAAVTVVDEALRAHRIGPLGGAVRQGKSPGTGDLTLWD